MCIRDSKSHYVIIFTVGAAKQLEPHTDLPSILSVPRQRQQTNVFSSEGVMEDIPLHLIVVPVPRHCLHTGERE